MTAPLRVLVVDDHPVVRAGLVGLLSLEPDLHVVGEAGDGRDALVLAARLMPDVVLMDLRMPGLDGAAATAALITADPRIRVLILTTYDTDDDIMRAVEAGAAGYLLKDTPRAALIEAVRATARGETVLAPTMVARLVRRVAAGAGGPGAPGSGGGSTHLAGTSPAGTHPAGVTEALTPRELDVLAGVAQGWSNAEIGRRLFIGESTVKTHLLRVFAKLSVDDRTRAVTRAFELGILPQPR